MKSTANRLLNMASSPKQFSEKHRKDFRQAGNFILYVFSDSYDYDDDENDEIECEECGKEFSFYISTRIKYCTNKLEKSK